MERERPASVQINGSGALGETVLVDVEDAFGSGIVDIGLPVIAVIIAGTIGVIGVSGIKIRITRCADRDKSPQSVIGIGYNGCISGEKRIASGIEITALGRSETRLQNNLAAGLQNGAGAGSNGVAGPAVMVLAALWLTVPVTISFCSSRFSGR